MSRPTWSEIAPQIGAAIAREDGRVCVLKDVEESRYLDPKKTVERVTPILVYKLRCGEVLQAREVSLNLYYPASTQDAPTCIGCVTEGTTTP